MKPTTEELIFAALVRTRIGELRLAKIKDMSEDEVQAFDAQPVNDLIEEAMEELTGIATFIRAWQEKNPPAEKP